jgi:hypothetical protein
MTNDASGKRGIRIAELNVLVLVICAALWFGAEFASNTVRWIMFFVVMGFFLIGFIVVVYGTVRKNKWGINFQRPVCPHCGVSAPLIRKPRTVQQALWGGWTCPSCGTEIDKWGRELVPPNSGRPTGAPAEPPH